MLMAKYCLAFWCVLICAGCTTDWHLQFVDADSHLPLKDVKVAFWATDSNALGGGKTYLGETYMSDDLGRVHVGKIPSDASCWIHMDHAGYFHLFADAGPGSPDEVWLTYSLLTDASHADIEVGRQHIPLRMPLVIPMRRLLGTTKPVSEQ